MEDYNTRDVSVVSKFKGEPEKEHWQVVQRIFRYRICTSDVDLIYEGDSHGSVIGYNSDYYYSGGVDSRMSMTRYVITLDGFVVSWSNFAGYNYCLQLKLSIRCWQKLLRGNVVERASWWSWSTSWSSYHVLWQFKCNVFSKWIRSTMRRPNVLMWVIIFWWTKKESR